MHPLVPVALSTLCYRTGEAGGEPLVLQMTAGGS